MRIFLGNAITQRVMIHSLALAMMVSLSFRRAIPTRRGFGPFLRGCDQEGREQEQKQSPIHAREPPRVTGRSAQKEQCTSARCASHVPWKRNDRVLIDFNGETRVAWNRGNQRCPRRRRRQTSMLGMTLDSRHSCRSAADSRSCGSPRLVFRAPVTVAAARRRSCAWPSDPRRRRAQ
jgi:hypothetical protein